MIPFPVCSRRFIGSLIITAWAVLCVGGCATPTTQSIEIPPEQLEKERQKQRELALRMRLQRQRRLMDLAFPLRRSAVPLCEGDVEPMVGLSMATRYTYDEEYRRAAAEVLGLGRHVQVIHVVENSPADRNGFRVGDVLVSIHDWTVPIASQGDSPFEEQSTTVRTHKRLQEAAETSDSVPIRIRRNGDTQTRYVSATNACSYSVHLVSDDSVNAFADGNKVGVTTGMMRFVENDTQLAVVVAHEIAHNSMGHISKKQQNAFLGLLLDIAAATQGVNTRGLFTRLGARAYSQDFEKEADYVGLYIMARADMGYREAPRLWRLMAAEFPGSIESNILSTHPATPERFESLERTIEEINQKKQHREELLPEWEQEENGGNSTGDPSSGSRPSPTHGRSPWSVKSVSNLLPQTPSHPMIRPRHGTLYGIEHRRIAGP